MKQQNSIEFIEIYICILQFIQGRCSSANFKFLVTKMNEKLGCWKRCLLNKAGRTTLARSVLSTIPVYYMQHLWLPISTCNKVDQIVRKFNCKDNDGVGLHLVGWDRLAQPRSHGGLGIRKAHHMNIAILGKLVATFTNNSTHPPWALLLKGIYGCSNLCFPPKANGGASATYRAICRSAAIPVDGFRYSIGRGDSNMWSVPWLEGGSLGGRVPYIHITNTAKRIRDIFSNGRWRTESLYTPLSPQILEEFNRFAPLIAHPQVSDGWVWEDGGKPLYSVKSGYSF